MGLSRCCAECRHRDHTLRLQVWEKVELSRVGLHPPSHKREKVFSNSQRSKGLQEVEMNEHTWPCIISPGHIQNHLALITSVSHNLFLLSSLTTKSLVFPIRVCSRLTAWIDLYIRWRSCWSLDSFITFIKGLPFSPGILFHEFRWKL